MGSTSDGEKVVAELIRKDKSLEESGGEEENNINILSKRSSFIIKSMNLHFWTLNNSYLKIYYSKMK
jgi:hypothetical protein